MLSAIVIFAVFLAAQALFSLYLMLYTWEHPKRLEASRGPVRFSVPLHTFTVLLPARHEEAVIYDTILRVWKANYPKDFLEIVVVCHADDAGTIAQAQRAVEFIGSTSVRVETFTVTPISKPRGLNVGLSRTRNEIVTIFDAEDDIHPDVFNLINTVMREEGVNVVQAGVQLMNFRDYWFSAHNCLEYYFWFKSRLHFHAHVGVIPLGGNTVFMRRELLERIGGWDEYCLTEDADIGIRMSALGERIRVVYDERYVTREETPDTVASFVKQRTRWHQGFLQVFRKAEWLRLPRFDQRILAAYTLSYPLFQAFLILLWPVTIVSAVFLKLPTLVVLVSFVPLYTLMMQCVACVVGARAFTQDFDLPFSWSLPFKLIATFLPFQFLLGVSAIRAVWREIWNRRDWEKTAHVGAHRQPAILGQPAVASVAWDSLFDLAQRHLGAERVSVMIWDQTVGHFALAASRGLQPKSGFSSRSAVIDWVAARRRSVVISGDDTPEELRAHLNSPALRSSVLVPFEHGGQVVAVVSLSSVVAELSSQAAEWLRDAIARIEEQQPNLPIGMVPKRPKTTIAFDGHR